MFKKIMSVMLAVVMLLSVAMIATSAAQVEIVDNNAEAPAEVAADASVADTGASNVLTFDASTTGWNNFKYIRFHIWEYGQDPVYAWASKQENGTDNGDGTWSYDLAKKGVTIESGKTYCVIFAADTGMQTYDLLFDASVVGDTAYCNGETLENPKDSNKTGQVAIWKNQDVNKYGPLLAITSIGNVVGSCLAPTTSRQEMFETFLKDTLLNAKTFSGKDDQTLLDDTAKALDLKVDNVSEAIKNTGVKVEWKAEKSSLPTGKDPDAGTKPEGGDTGNNGNNGNNGGNSGSGTNQSGSGSGSGSSSGSGSGSNTKTGQTSTALFIMLGIMVAAAVVIVVARKRERA